MHSNNFDFLRITAAMLVFISHSFALYNMHEPTFLTSSAGMTPINLGTYGVSIFFAISGYLIMQSCVQSSGIVPFAWKRVLRLYPALLLNFFLIIVFIIPLTIDMSLPDYYMQIRYTIGSIALSLITLSPLNIAHAFPGNFAGQANTALWTLPVEASCYIILAIIGFTRWRRLLFPLCLLAFLVLGYRLIAMPTSVFQLKYMHAFTFFMAANFFLYRKYIPLNAPLAVLCLGVQIVLFACNWYILPLYALSVTYLTLYAALKAPYLGNAAKYGDFSYGLYIYAWPWQQSFSLIFARHPENFRVYVLFSFLCIAACAFISWHLVEKRALMLRRRVDVRKDLPS